MRVTVSPTRHKRRKKWVKLARGYWGHRSRSYKSARQAVVRGWNFAFRDRKQVKREYRKLWVSRINAAVRPFGTTYAPFMNKVRQAKVGVNRKMLSELAIRHPEAFAALVRFTTQSKKTE